MGRVETINVMALSSLRAKDRDIEQTVHFWVAGIEGAKTLPCRAWQDKAANLLYKGILESDESFFRFNLSAIHHEKAKSLLCWQKTREDRKLVRSKLVTALETLHPDLNVWRAYYDTTEARLNLADHDIEGSAQAGKAALKIARAMHSNKPWLFLLFLRSNDHLASRQFACTGI